jgi:hypothetical protein
MTADVALLPAAAVVLAVHLSVVALQHWQARRNLATPRHFVREFLAADEVVSGGGR